MPRETHPSDSHLCAKPVLAQAAFFDVLSWVSADGGDGGSGGSGGDGRGGDSDDGGGDCDVAVTPLSPGQRWRFGNAFLWGGWVKVSSPPPLCNDLRSIDRSFLR